MNYTAVDVSLSVFRRQRLVSQRCLLRVQRRLGLLFYDNSGV